MRGPGLEPAKLLQSLRLWPGCSQGGAGRWEGVTVPPQADRQLQQTAEPRGGAGRPSRSGLGKGRGRPPAASPASAPWLGLPFPFAAQRRGREERQQVRPSPSRPAPAHPFAPAHPPASPFQRTGARPATRASWACAERPAAPLGGSLSPSLRPRAPEPPAPATHSLTHSPPRGSRRAPPPRRSGAARPPCRAC